MFDILNHLEASNGLLSFAEVRAMLGISERALRTMVADKSIPSLLIGGQRKFCPSALHRWIIKKCPQMASSRGSKLVATSA